MSSSEAGLIPASFRTELEGRSADPLERHGAGPTGEAWLAALPGLIAEHLEAWDLAVQGPAWHGACALVVPVQRSDGQPAALKLTWPHVEAAHEHLALRTWDGHGAVQLLAADPARFVLLLERLDGDRDLHALPVMDACAEIGRLLRELDRPAPPRIPRLAEQIPRWQRSLADEPAGVPRRLLQQARSHLTDLAPHEERKLVHTDLHFANALAPIAGAGAGTRSGAGAEPRRDWLAIDPKPLAGEGAYAVAPAIWNRAEEAARAHSFAAHVRTRADVLGDAAGLDPERVRMWTFVRFVVNALDAAEQGAAADPFRTRMIALAKAFATP